MKTNSSNPCTSCYMKRRKQRITMLTRLPWRNVLVKHKISAPSSAVRKLAYTNHPVLQSSQIAALVMECPCPETEIMATTTLFIHLIGVEEREPA